MTTERYLIVNADDFGRSPGINRGVARAFEHGVVTSASLMVRWSAAAGAAAYARAHPALSVGLHVDLGEWVLRGGSWVAAYEVVPPDDATAVRDEVARQLETFVGLVGRPPTHLDSHQHVHRLPPAGPVLLDLARRLGVPVRHHGEVRYCGDFFGQDGTGERYPQLVSGDSLIRIVRALSPGVTELACHPGEGADFDSPYDRERELELAALCDPRVRRAISEEGVRLRSFHRSENRGPAPARAC